MQYELTNELINSKGKLEKLCNDYTNLFFQYFKFNYAIKYYKIDANEFEIEGLDRYEGFEGFHTITVSKGYITLE